MSDIDIDFNAKSYGVFIEKTTRDTKEILDKENIAFLMN